MGAGGVDSLSVVRCALLFMGLVLPSCSAVIEEREADVVEEPGCLPLAESTKAADPRAGYYLMLAVRGTVGDPPGRNARLVRYDHLDGDLGEEAPETVESKSESETRSYLSQAVATKPPAEDSWTLTDLWLALGITLQLAAIILVWVGLIVRDWSIRRRALTSLAGVVCLAAAVGSGHLAGSILYVDNPSGSELEVVLDGTRMRVPPGSAAALRLSGSEIAAEVFRSGALVESVLLHIDRSFGEQVERALFGNGKFIYSVCGFNSYQDSTVRYGKGQ